jgi:protein-tyrosine phosphatase
LIALIHSRDFGFQHLAADKIIERLYVGDIQDAVNTDRLENQGKWLVICVLETKPVREPKGAIWIPIIDQAMREDGSIKVNKKNLDSLADTIDKALKEDQRDILLHCGMGSERSPLAAAWFLYRKRNMSFEDAYKLVREKRPATMDRTVWVMD